MPTIGYGSTKYKTNRRLVLAAAGGRCAVAGCDRTATTADHIIPLARGGSDDLDNLRAMCRRHNCSGGADLTNQKRRARRIGPQSRTW